jgi:hypothetical protein
MKILCTSVFLLTLLCNGLGSTPTSIRGQIRWLQEGKEIREDGRVSMSFLRFEGAVYDSDNPGLPLFSETIPLSGFGHLQAFLIDAEFEKVPENLWNSMGEIAADIELITKTQKERENYFSTLTFLPIRKAGNTYERMVSYEIRLVFQVLPATPVMRGGQTYTSVLSEGDVYKISVSESGIFKLDYDFLKNKLGIPVDNIDPRTIKIYGSSGGVLPEIAGLPRKDDLVEIAAEISGESDGKFNTNDFILFYAEGADVMNFDQAGKFFSRPRNFYDTRNYYFIKISPGNGLRIVSQPSLTGSTYSAQQFDDFIHYEEENFNLMHDWAYGEGSGRQWFGDYFKNVTSKNYDNIFKVDNLVANASVKFKVSVAGRIQSGSFGRFNFTANGNSFSSSNFNTTFGGSTDTYASEQTINGEFIPGTNTLQLKLDFIKGPETFNEAWLDAIVLNFRRSLSLVGNQMSFRDLTSLNHKVSTFRLGNAAATTVVWDITDPLKPVRQEATSSGSELSFSVKSEVLKEFIAFNNSTGFKSAEAIGKIARQNLHETKDVDLIIVYPKAFQHAAEKLAAHRRTHSNLKVVLAETGQIYNEFSSGRKDVSAIRDFAKMVFDRNPQQLRYLLLLGDGSFDSRNIYKLGNDFIPVYETPNSLSPIYAFPTDDYYALLSDDEGGNINSGLLDISVGRLPVKTPEEAMNVVDKIINYDKNPATYGDWRNRIAFIGDDEDYNLHTGDAEGIAIDLAKKNSNLNIDKIYLDAFPQESTPGGTRVPLATEAINRNMFKGILAMIYLGHGGTKGWAQERVLKIEDILSWQNQNHMPLVITATCSFAAYDNPAFTSAGELAFLNRNGGAIGLYTTVRPVFASSNERLTRATVDTLFFIQNRSNPPLGEVLRLSKNRTGDPSNSRKFLLIGDPSQKLSLPNYEVVTTKINGKEISMVSSDTIGALQRVTIEGEIQNSAGIVLQDFNGEIFPTIYDKKIRNRTLAQDADSPPFEFDLQKNILFKGRASVKNGKFSFTFVVPKDIDYKYGFSKISYYAFNAGSLDDATGNYQKLTVGGTNVSSIPDNKGPRVDVFINDENFVFGGITAENPQLYIKLEDDNGINVVGNSVGHDLAAVIDDNSKNTYILNDFYEAVLDDYKRGVVKYPISKLPEGRHQVRVTAWDIANNSSEGYTEFVVVNSDKISLKHVLNFPNPFINSTCFMFEHNKSGVDLDILIQIYTLSGRLIKSIEQRIFSEGFRLGSQNCLSWDGRDDYGDPLAKGVYLYKVKLRGAEINGQILEGESDFQKLVILK